MRARALGSISILALLGLVFPGVARAERDERAALFADSALVVSVRPVAFGAALRRLGSGWETLARRVLPLPAAASPLDARVLALTGLAPARLGWLGLRALRGGLHLRVAVPLSQARVAEALLQSAAGAMGIELSRGLHGEWGGRAPGGIPILARLDGETLVLDLVQPGPTATPTPADLARIIPLRPPRAWRGDRGLARRMGPADGIALWADLTLVSQVALVHGEGQLSQALKLVHPSMRAQISRAGREELATCKMALNASSNTFDEARAALVVRGPDELGIELALGGRAAAIEKLSALHTHPPNRPLGEGLVEADLGVQLHAPLPILTGVDPPEPRARAELPEVCPLGAKVAIALRSWPRLRGRTTPLWAQVLAQVRGASIQVSFPAEGEPPTVSPPVFVALAELEPGARDKIDRLLGDDFGPVAPLRVGARQLTAWATRAASSRGREEGPLVVIDPNRDGGAAGTLVGVGARDLVRARLERLGSTPPGPPPALASATVSPRGLLRILRALGSAALVTAVLAPAALATLVDGVSRLDALLLLEPGLIRFETTIGLAPGGHERSTGGVE